MVMAMKLHDTLCASPNLKAQLYRSNVTTLAALIDTALSSSHTEACIHSAAAEALAVEMPAVFPSIQPTSVGWLSSSGEAANVS